MQLLMYLLRMASGQILDECPYKNELIVWNRSKGINDAFLKSFVNIVSMARCDSTTSI